MPDDRSSSAASGVAHADNRAWVKIGPGGRVVIPAPMRRALGLGEGDYVQIRMEDEELRVIPRDTVYRRVQDAVTARVPPGVSLADGLIAERRREVEREERGE